MRHLGYLLIGYVGLVLMSTLVSVLPFRVLAPDLVLALLCLLALQRHSPVAGLVLALVLGYLTDLFSGAPKGLHAEALGICFLVVRVAAVRMQVIGTAALMMLVFFTALLEAGLLAVLTQYAGLAGPGLSSITSVPAQALVTALFAPVVALALRRLDRALGRVPGPSSGAAQSSRAHLGVARGEGRPRLEFRERS